MSVKAFQKNIMEISRCFSEVQTSATLNYSQMAEILSLPAEDTEKFIAEKASDSRAATEKLSLNEGAEKNIGDNVSTEKERRAGK